MNATCTNRCKPSPLPPSFPVDLARSHPTFRYYLEPGARCTLEAGHEGPHRTVGLVWHDPPLLLVGGVPFVAPAEREQGHR